jgi:hypothetical protein
MMEGIQGNVVSPEVIISPRMPKPDEIWATLFSTTTKTYQHHQHQQQ